MLICVLPADGPFGKKHAVDRTPQNKSKHSTVPSQGQQNFHSNFLHGQTDPFSCFVYELEDQQQQDHSPTPCSTR